MTTGPSIASSILGLALFGMLAGVLGLWNEWNERRWQEKHWHDRGGRRRRGDRW